MPQHFWGEAVVSAAYLINRIPSNILNFQTPLQTLHYHIQTPPTPNLEPRIFSYSDQSPEENDQLSLRCQNQEDEIELFNEILSASTPVPHQSPAEEHADTPIEMNNKLCEDMDQEPTNKEQYQRLVGRLIYLAHTRPDIAYAVSVVSQFMHSPSVSHRNAIDHILRYLKSALGKRLMFSKNGDLEVVGYTDAD
ncbi:unnamed protein product [Prunus brigantina]